ncbi:MAG TPA: D-alanyl-D-alanine carboxypeptidase family protein [Dissulfurispiraceae bacterium]|nr:D-alanyl-D-alanine carboxypeptidase family protein [Dissulfurispiraceae bacterium]
MKTENFEHPGFASSDSRFTLLKMLIFIIMIMLAALSNTDCAFADDISAKAAVVIDGATGNILYAKNPNVKLFPASTTKLVTAMIVLDRLDPETIVTVSQEAADTPSVSPHLRAGEKLKVRDLLNIALIRSVNSAAVALAEAVSGSEEAFTKLMNEKARSLGAENTHYVNASGLPGGGQYITAFDLSLIMKGAIGYPVIKEIVKTRSQQVYTEGGRKIVVKNTNHLLWTDEDMVGGKTGYTRAAKHCFVCAGQKGDRMLVAAVLGESVRNELWHDSSTLLARGDDVLNKKREPEIYYTSVSNSPVVYASHKVKKKQRLEKIRASKIGKGGKSSKKKIAARKKSATKKNSATKKKVNKKKGGAVNARNKTAAQDVS